MAQGWAGYRRLGAAGLLAAGLLWLPLAGAWGAEGAEGAEGAAPATAGSAGAAGRKRSFVEPGHSQALPLPENINSAYGAEVDELFHWILWLTGGAFLLTEGVLVYALLQFRHVEGAKVAAVRGSFKLQLVWTVVPGLLLFGLAVTGAERWQRIQAGPGAGAGEPPLRIEVFATQYEWNFRYAGKDGVFGRDPAQPAAAVDDVYEVKELYLPRGRRVVLEMQSGDVIHSLFLPQLRFRQDVAPGLTTTGWFVADQTTKEGRAARGFPYFSCAAGRDGRNSGYFNYEIACAELCGPQHGFMRGEVYVLEPEEFAQFLAAEAARQKDYAVPAVWSRWAPDGN